VALPGSSAAASFSFTVRVVFKAPEQFTTRRFTLRKPVLSDAAAVFGWASDVEVTRYMGWPTHKSIADTQGFMTFATREWVEKGVGTYFVEHQGRVIGSTGLHVVNRNRAMIGYIFRRDAWGQGFATESCRAMVELGRSLGFARIEAQCHTTHGPSARVLEKAGMEFEGVLRSYLVFPNLDGAPGDVRSYSVG
jgi:ribosomal-protein-alanine N-acetyltransferase